MQQEIRVMLLEHDEADALSVKRMLKKAEISSTLKKKFIITEVKSPESHDEIYYGEYDVILVSLCTLQKYEGVVENIVFHSIDAPVIVLSIHDNELLSLKAIKKGAQDVLIKGQFTGSRLVQSIEFAIERHKLLSGVQQLALVDGLTGLYNRRGFKSLAIHHAEIAKRKSRKMLLIYIDLDGMKQINDTFGHEKGDEALVEAATILKRSFRTTDIVARIGGDEFAVLAVESEEDNKATMLKRLRKNIEIRNAIKESCFNISMSIGAVSWSESEFPKIDELMREADKEMYSEKVKKRRIREEHVAEIVSYS